MARTRPPVPTAGLGPPTPGPKPPAPSPFLAAAKALFAQATAYAQALGMPDAGDLSAVTFLPYLATGVSSADLFTWFRQFADRLKGQGRTFYNEDTGAKTGTATLTGFFEGRLANKTYGDSVTETSDDRRRQFHILNAQLQGALDDIAHGAKPEETNFAVITAQLKALETKPLGGGG